MTGFEWSLQSPVMVELGRVLLHFLWQGALVAGALGVLLVAFRGGSARLRYAVCCAALLLMLFLPVVTFVTIHGEAPRIALNRAAPDVRDVPAGEALAAPPPESGSQRYLGFVVAAWMAGVSLFSLRLLGGSLLVARVVRGSAASRRWQQAADRIAARLRAPRLVRVLETVRVPSPLSVGWLRPVVLLPLQALSGLSADEVEAVLAHEIAHVVRHDYLVNLLQVVTETVLFYHPAVWWVSARVREEREHCCDDMVVATLGRRDVYARALLRLEETRAGYALGLAAAGGDLRARIERILSGGESRTAGSWALGAALAGLLAGAIVLGLSLGARDATASISGGTHTIAGSGSHAQAESSAKQKAAGVCMRDARFRKWLNEDVVYIITPEERRAVDDLKAERDCADFITQFWRRRDPRPDTPENEFREEHYRRIAYANEHFAMDQAPGWRTDRGRIYIVYGPPDEIESHPGDFERWHYRYIRNLGIDVNFDFRGPELRLDSPKNTH